MGKSEWQPIETAPKGERILVLWSDGYVTSWERWEPYLYAMQPTDTRRLSVEGWFSPTHWAPMPELPQAQEAAD